MTKFFIFNRLSVNFYPWVKASICWEGSLLKEYTIPPISLTFGRQGGYHTNTGRLQISTRAARQTFWVASLLAGSTSSRPFFCFLCNLRSLHDAQARHRRTPLRSFTSIREIAPSAPPVRRRGRRDPKLLQPTESQRYRCPTASQRYSATGILLDYLLHYSTWYDNSDSIIFFITSYWYCVLVQ